MKITIGGSPGAGKSTVAKLLAKKIDYIHKSTGDFFRELAKEQNISLSELSKKAELDHSVDQKIDKMTEEFGSKNDNFVMDSRLAFYFIPDSIKIFLDVDPAIGAKRIFQDKKESRTVESAGSLEELETKIQERMSSEKKRYKELYNINHYKLDNYDLLINTSDMSPEDVIITILEFLKLNNKF